MNYITDYESVTPEKNLYFCGLEDIDNGKNKYSKSIVYIDPSKSLKLILKTPYLIVPFGVSTLKNSEGAITMYTLTTTLTPLIGKKNQFKKLIEAVDDVVEQKIDKMLEDVDFEYDLRKSIRHNKKKKYFHNFTMGLRLKKNGEQFFGLFNYDDEICSLEKIIPGSRIRALVELTEVFVNHDSTTYRCNWNAIQIKLYPEVIIEKCLIRDEVSNGSIINMDSKKKIKKKYDLNCPNCSHAIELNINLNIHSEASSSYVPRPSYAPRQYAPAIDPCIPVPPPLDLNHDVQPDNGQRPFVPKLDDLLSALKKLKPTKTVVKEIETGHVIPEAPPLISDEPKKVSKGKNLLNKMQKLVKKIKEEEKNN